MDQADVLSCHTVYPSSLNLSQLLTQAEHLAEIGAERMADKWEMRNLRKLCKVFAAGNRELPPHPRAGVTPEERKIFYDQGAQTESQ